jgi:MFS family permease
VTVARPGGGILSPDRRALTIGLVLTISVTAFETLAVATVMPIAARELHGLRYYGWTFSAFMLANLVGIVVAGPSADRHGPARPFATGLLMFGIGLAAGGAAPSMGLLVAARAVQGYGAGGLSAVAYVSIGRSYDESLRPRMMAVLSSAWVLPSLVGPSLAGLAADHFTWRLVFFVIMATCPVAAVLVLPALRPMSGAPADAGTEEPDLPVLAAIRLAAGAGLVVGGLGVRSPAPAVALVVVGSALGVPAFLRLVPPGTARARPGLPAAIAVRGLMTFAFFGTEAFLTLSITDVVGRSATAAGLAVTVAALSWTAASWVQARMAGRRTRRALVFAGLGFVITGIALVSLVLLPDLAAPVAVAAGAWVVAGFGMGLAYPTTTLEVLARAGPGRVGAASASMQLADVLGTALGTGLGGAVVSLAVTAGSSRRAGVAGAFALCLCSGLIALIAARRFGPEPAFSS